MVKTKYYLLIIFVIIIGGKTKAQDYDAFAFDIKSNIDYRASMKNNYIIKNLLANKTLSENDKNEILSDLRNKEIGALDFFGDAKLYYHFKNIQLFDYLHIGYAYHNFYEIMFSNNSLDLLLNGNAQWMGETTELDNNYFNQLVYHEIVIGVNKKIKQFEFGISFGFNIGEKYQSYSLNNASLYTAEDATSIELNGDLKYCQSSEQNQSYGFSTDIYFNTEKLRFMIDNLGFIQWKNASYYSQNEKNIYFDGLEFNLNSNFSTENLLDSLQLKYGLITENAIITTALPAHIIIEYDLLKNKEKPYELMLKADYYLFTKLAPRLFIQPAYRFDINQVLLRVYGIFSISLMSDYNIGIGLSASLFDKYRLSIETSYLSSYLLPKAFSGMGAQVKLSKKLYQ